MRKNAIQIMRASIEGIAKKNARQNISVPKYMGCLTQEYMPESSSLGWSLKTTLCAFIAKYPPKLSERIARNKRKKKGTKSTKTVE
jgi:hypothetical protein